MEKIKEDISQKEYTYIINRIEEEKELFCSMHNINDIQEVTQNVYTACLMHIGKTIFIEGFWSIGSNKNILDYVLIDKISAYYIYICKLYNKISSIYDFTLFINIPYRSFILWKQDVKNIDIYNNIDICNIYNAYNNNYHDYIILLEDIYNKNVDIITALKADIFYKLHEDRQQALTTKLVNNQNAMGTITTVNREYSWNMQEAQKMQAVKMLTITELPALETL